MEFDNDKFEKLKKLAKKLHERELHDEVWDEDQILERLNEITGRFSQVQVHNSNKDKEKILQGCQYLLNDTLRKIKNSHGFQYLDEIERSNHILVDLIKMKKSLTEQDVKIIFFLTEQIVEYLKGALVDNLRVV